MKHIFGKKAGQSGFSLVELMIVVGIIGVLATLALPRFKQFQAKAKLAEAQNVLQHIYTLQQSYALDHTIYQNVAAIGAGAGAVGGNNCPAAGANAGADAIGLRIDPCVAAAPTPRFSYVVTANTSIGFIADARSGAGAGNRVCPNNVAFAISLNQGNVSSWGVGTTGNRPGTAQIGTICPN